MLKYLAKLLLLLALATLTYAQDDPNAEIPLTEEEEKIAKAEEKKRKAEEKKKKEENCAKLACNVFTEDGTAYDLKPLTKIGDDNTDDYVV